MAMMGDGWIRVTPLWAVALLRTTHEQIHTMMTDSEEAAPIPVSIPLPRQENEGIPSDNDVDIGENIELRLKPQHPTFSFDEEGSHNIEEDFKKHSGHSLYTEKTMRADEVEREEKREEEVAEKERQARLKQIQEDMKKEEAGVDGHIKEVSEKRNTSPQKKVKPQPVSSINVRDLLINIHKIKSLNEINGTVSMSILSLLVDELIWLTDFSSNGSITDKDITETIFGDQVFTSIIDHYNEKTNDDNDNNNNNNNNDIESNTNSNTDTETEENNEATKDVSINDILNEILDKKLRTIDRKRLELISRSQEELGIPFKKSSKILSNFELDVKPTLSSKDLTDYVSENIGRYEKCSNDQSTLTWISNKFYLKSAPKMELDCYIDRINSHLEISGAVGLCAGWYLFKFLFNLKCNEKLSDGITNLQFLNNLNENIQWESRSLPLVLGSSFKLTTTPSSSEDNLGSDYEDDEHAEYNNNVNNNDNSQSHDYNIQNNDIYAQPMDTSFSSCSSIINDDDTNNYSIFNCRPNSSTDSKYEVHMSKISKLNAFRLILTCVRISSKLIEDKNFKQHYYCKVTGLQKLEDLFRLELALGYGLDWELFINEYTLWRYLFHMRALVIGCDKLRAKLAHENGN